METSIEEIKIQYENLFKHKNSLKPIYLYNNEIKLMFGVQRNDFLYLIYKLKTKQIVTNLSYINFLNKHYKKWNPLK